MTTCPLIRLAIRRHLPGLVAVLILAATLRAAWASDCAKFRWDLVLVSVEPAPSGDTAATAGDVVGWLASGNISEAPEGGDVHLYALTDDGDTGPESHGFFLTPVDQ